MLFDELSKSELKNLIVKNWMTHDGAWFLNSYLRLGIKEANKLNKRSIKTLAQFEVKRVKNLSEQKDTDISSYKELKKFVKNAFSIVKGDFMKFEYSFPEENRIQWEMNKCFAYEGMKKLGVEKEYECGVLYRVSCWLNELGINHKIKPKVKKCLLNSQDKCAGDIIISFNQ